jgi:hypothetical protein
VTANTVFTVDAIGWKIETFDALFIAKVTVAFCDEFEAIFIGKLYDFFRLDF